MPFDPTTAQPLAPPAEGASPSAFDPSTARSLEPEDPGLFGAVQLGLGSALRSGKQTGQLLTGQQVDETPEAKTLAEQPTTWGDVLHPKALAEKTLYGLAESAPELAAFVGAGALASETGPIGAGTAGALAAGAVNMAKSLGPFYAAALKSNPDDPNAAFDKALEMAGTSGAFNALTFKLFDIAPFKSAVQSTLFKAFGVADRAAYDEAAKAAADAGTAMEVKDPVAAAAAQRMARTAGVKDLALQAGAVQPAAAVVQHGVQNIEEGRPAQEGVLDDVPGAILGTAVPALGHAALAKAAGSVLPRAADAAGKTKTDIADELTGRLMKATDEEAVADPVGAAKQADDLEMAANDRSQNLSEEQRAGLRQRADALRARLSAAPAEPAPPIPEKGSPEHLQYETLGQVRESGAALPEHLEQRYQDLHKLFNPPKPAEPPPVAPPAAEPVAPGLVGVQPRDPDKLRAVVNAIRPVLQKIAPGAEARIFQSLDATGANPGPVFGAWLGREGQGLSRVIAFALNSDDPVVTARHEAIHYLRDVGLINDKDWGTLTKAAEDGGWVTDGLRKQYHDLSDDKLVEEAIAHQFQNWRGGERGQPQGVRGAFYRLGQMLNRIAAKTREVFGKDATPDDIFHNIESGRTGRGKERVEPSQTSEVMAQRAYHGTPHDFDQFDISKIGTGEGAQAFGHGLYFAGRQGIAEHYRDRLSQQPTKMPKHVVEALSRLDLLGFDTPAQAMREIRVLHNSGEDWKEHFDVTGAFAANDEALAAGDREDARIIDEYLAQGRPKRGKLYQVDLKPTDAELLHWDKPVSQQPPKVRAALEKLGVKPQQATIHRGVSEINTPLYQVWLPDGRRAEFSTEIEATNYAKQMSSPAAMRGEHAYRDVAERLAKPREEPAPSWTNVPGGAVHRDGAFADEAGASRALLEQGVRGIKYLDASARDQARAAARDLSGWQDAVKRAEASLSMLTVERHRLARYPDGDAKAATLAEISRRESDAQTELKRAQDGLARVEQHANPGPEEHNYVMFDDRDIGIEAKFQRAPAEDTPEFKRWFGESKVVDEDGKPLVVYHGSPHGAFDAFDPSKKGTTTFIGIPVETQRHGFFFTDDKDFAKSFADQSKTGAVMPVYLSIKNPLRMTSAGVWWKDIERLVAQGVDRNWLENHAGDPRSTWEQFDDENGAFFVPRIKAAGYDGALIEEHDPATDKTIHSWIAFEPTQIKSAAGDNRSFDPTDKRIAFRRAPKQEGEGTPEAPIRVAHPDHMQAARDRVNPEPTEGQKDAGNYAKGHVKIHGLDIAIENPKDSVRRGVGADGKPWESRLPADYGYIKRTEGADGDHVDTFIGPHPESERVFLVDQKNAETGKFDEHKAMLGYDTPAAALLDYGRAFSDGKAADRVHAVHEMPIDGFKQWLKQGDTKTPLASQVKGNEVAFRRAPAEFRDLTEEHKTAAHNLEAARRQGYDVETPWYVGSPTGGQLLESGAFDRNRMDPRGLYGPAIYVTGEPSEARYYAEAGVTGQRIPVENPQPRMFRVAPKLRDTLRTMQIYQPGDIATKFGLQTDSSMSGEEIYHKLVSQAGGDKAAANHFLQQRGIDGVYHTRNNLALGQRTRNLAVFDPANLRRLDAAFAPERQGESGLMFRRGEREMPQGELDKDPLERALTVNDILDPKTPALPTNSRNVGEIARDLMHRGSSALKALGVRSGRIDEPAPRTDEIISRAIASEIKAALGRGSKSAADWYTTRVRQAMATASTMHPELAKDPLARSAYTAALAITSQGETVPSNVRLADKVYRTFKETGRFPTDVVSKSQGPMNSNFGKLNDLIDRVGISGLRDFLDKEFTVRELKAQGYKIHGEKMDTPVSGSMILGAKIGQGFYQNLNGNYKPVTMDLWFMRAWGRLTGTLVGQPSAEVVRQQRERFVEALKDAGQRVPQTTPGMVKLAERAIAEHEKDFKANRALFDSGERAKSELAYAAERFMAGRDGINENPSSGGHRAWMRERINRANELLAENGVNVSNADLQAIWWYPEKDLYAKLGGRPSEGINVDYASAIADLARRNGVSDDQIAAAVRALDRGPGSAEQGRAGGRGADDARAAEGAGGRRRAPAGQAQEGPAFQRGSGQGASRTDDAKLHETARSYARRGGKGDGRNLGVYDPRPDYVERRAALGMSAPPIAEVKPDRFYDAASKAKQDNPKAAAFTLYKPEEYASTRTFLTEDGTAGVALKPDGDIVSVFKHPDSPHAKVGNSLVHFATEMGGKKLDAYDTVLPHIYGEEGFKAVARTPWNDEYKPDGWSYEDFAKYNNGRPDVVFMVHDPSHGKLYQAGDGKMVSEYDNGVAAQTKALAGEGPKFQRSDEDEKPALARAPAAAPTAPGAAPRRDIVDIAADMAKGSTIGQFLRKAFVPGAYDAFAKAATSLIIKTRGEAYVHEVQVREKFKAVRQAVDDATPELRDKFARAVDGSAADRAALPDDLRRLANAFTEMTQAETQRLQRLGARIGQPILSDAMEHYLGRYWKPRDAAADTEESRRKVLGALDTKTPLTGPKSFLKSRYHDTWGAAIDAGLEPVFENPVDAHLAKLAEMNRYYAGVVMAEGAKRGGFARFFSNGQQPEGWMKLEGPEFKRAAMNIKDEEGNISHVPEGHWYAPEGFSRVFNNYQSKGLEATIARDVVNGWRSIANGMNSLQLGFSLFHPAFTTVDAQISRVGMGIDNLVRGQFGKGVGQIIEGATPLNWYTNIRDGNRLLQSVLRPDDAPPEMRRLVDALGKAGGRIAMDRNWRTADAGIIKFWKSGAFGDAWRQAAQKYEATPLRPVKQALNIFGRLIDTTMAPVMEVLVPRQKLGVFSRMAKDWIDRNPHASDTEYVRNMQDIWESVDNRLGQMTYDNLMWSKAQKDWAHLMVRSVGWNMGSFREIPVGAFDAAKFAGNVARLRFDQAEWTRRMSYITALPLMAAMYGTVYSYLATGEGPQELRDYFFPKTGFLLKDGSPERVSIPTYMKDVVGWWTHPSQTAVNKLHPAVTAAIHMLQNKDYLEDPIRNYDDPLVKQVEDMASYAFGQFEPFSIQATRKLFEEHPGPIAAGGMLGFNPAPHYISNPEAEKAREAKQHAKDMKKKERDDARRNQPSVLRPAG